MNNQFRVRLMMIPIKCNCTCPTVQHRCAQCRKAMGTEWGVGSCRMNWNILSNKRRFEHSLFQFSNIRFIFLPPSHDSNSPCLWAAVHITGAEKTWTSCVKEWERRGTEGGRSFPLIQEGKAGKAKSEIPGYCLPSPTSRERKGVHDGDPMGMSQAAWTGEVPGQDRHSQHRLT